MQNSKLKKYLNNNSTENLEMTSLKNGIDNYIFSYNELFNLGLDLDSELS